jgi:hypothetical protein
MIKSKVLIIGGGLYGCLTALKIKEKYKNQQVEIFESGKSILSSFNNVKINNIKINNGFHGIEIPRASKLVDFLKSKMQIKFNLKLQKKYIILNDRILREGYDINLLNIKQYCYFNKKKFHSDTYNDFYVVFKNKFKKLLKLCSTRYSNNINNVNHLFIPWFLPKQFVYKGIDEGDKFRSKVRSNKINSFYAFPKKYIFSSLKSSIKKKMLDEKIVIRTKSKVIFYKDNFYIGSIEKKNLISNKIIFICSSPLFILKNSKMLMDKLIRNPRFFVNLIVDVFFQVSYFSEILCLSIHFPELSRISILKKSKKNTILHLEIFLKDQKLCNKEFFNQRIKNLLDNINYQEDIKNKKFKILGFHISRKVYFPPPALLNKVDNYISKKIKKSKFNKILGKSSVLPMNMSKSWIYSENSLRQFKLNNF